MPELPEVETMRRGVEMVAGHAIADVERPPCRRRPITIRPRFAQLRRRLVGRKFTAVERLGKRLVFVVDTGDRLIIEPRMTGLALLADPPTRDHLRLRISFVGKGARELLFWDRRGLGTVSLYSNDEFATNVGLSRIGPDAIAVAADQFRERLARGRRAIKVALLDQKAIAGVGNLYASEILHVAKVDPRSRCNELSLDQWRRLHTATRRVLAAAIRYEGSTLADGAYRNALNQTGEYQNHHRVYDLAGERCRTCRDAKIERIVQAQRSTFFCPECQRG